MVFCLSIISVIDEFVVEIDLVGFSKKIFVCGGLVCGFVLGVGLVYLIVLFFMFN